MDRTGPSTTLIPIDPDNLRPSPDAVARYFGGANYQLTPKVYERVFEGIEQAAGLVSPMAAFRVLLTEKIKSKAKSERWKKAHSEIILDLTESSIDHFAVYLATLGGALEATCRQLIDQNKLHQAMLLDAVGTAMLDILGEKIEKRVESRAHELGLFAGCRLGPGLNGVALENQALLFHLFEGETVGVQLNESFVMHPSKSISAYVLFSDEEQGEAIGNKCSRCKMERCQFRVRPE